MSNMYKKYDLENKNRISSFYGGILTNLKLKGYDNIKKPTIL